MSEKPTQKSVQKIIEERLQEAFRPTFLKVVNFSEKHAGHSGVAGDVSGETHFRIHIEAEAFENGTRIAAHRLIYGALKDLMDAPIHALEVRIGLTD